MEDSMNGYNGSCCYGIFQLCTFPKEKSIERKTEVIDPNVKNPPFVGDIPAPLQPSSVIIVVGEVNEDCERFSVNLLCSEGDIALHVNPRFNQRHIVVNHQMKGRWGPEQVTSLKAVNLERQSMFSIYVIVGDDNYFIALNNTHICTFPFKIPLRRVVRVEVIGDVIVNSVNYSNSNIYPDPLLSPEIRTLYFDSSMKEEFKLPFICKLSEGFKHGQQIDVEGAVKLLPHSFTINLQDASQMWPHPLVALHLNPRFGSTEGFVYVVRNSWQNGRWGHEERAPGFQFIPGHRFNLTIQCEDEEYSIWVNDSLVAAFKFRMSSELVSHLLIDGDIFVNKVQYHSNLGQIHFNKFFDKSGLD